MVDWNDDGFIVMSDDPDVAVGRMGSYSLELDYADDSDMRDDGKQMCPNSRSDRVVCRMWKDHEGPCIPFASELVESTGVYVLGVRE